MRTHIQKWGNSLALRIPIQFSRHFHFAPGTMVDISLEDDHLLIKPQKETLDYLLLQITPDNLHGEIFEDDAPQGQEIW
ncbi:MAG: AbrB/MazE/SpoVT family DNA-binding domain-containing protein [Proteobacteria bacterium]|nr:AbrB/MazE/SpoVT family DNA-binding domain-containing protein [Pseudomonadota bacterium]